MTVKTYFILVVFFYMKDKTNCSPLAIANHFPLADIAEMSP